MKKKEKKKKGNLNEAPGACDNLTLTPPGIKVITSGGCPSVLHPLCITRCIEVDCCTTVTLLTWVLSIYTLPFIKDVSFHFVELFAKETAGFERQAAPLPGPVAQRTAEREDKRTQTEQSRTNMGGGGGGWKWFSTLLVIDHFHVAVLLDPKLANNYVVDTAGGVCPGVRFIMPTQRRDTVVDLPQVYPSFPLMLPSRDEPKCQHSASGAALSLVKTGHCSCSLGSAEVVPGDVSFQYTPSQILNTVLVQLAWFYLA